MDIVKNIISFVVMNAADLTPKSYQPTLNGLHFVEDFQGSGCAVYRIHKLHMFPTVLVGDDVANTDTIQAAVAQLAHVQYDASSMWFTIDKV